MSAGWNDFETLRRPVVTEKSYAAQGAANQYTFRVERRATKQQVKQAVEAIFGVDVEQVRILNLPGKPKRRGMREGRRPGYRKAIVRLAAGQSLEVAEEG